LGGKRKTGAKTAPILYWWEVNFGIGGGVRSGNSEDPGKGQRVSRKGFCGGNTIGPRKERELSDETHGGVSMGEGAPSTRSRRRTEEFWGGRKNGKR